MFWDFHVNNQESIHALMFLFGDRGKFTKADGSYVYVRIHFHTNQGIHYNTNAEGAKLAGTEPDRHLLDLQDAINSGNYPSWNVYVQVIHPSDISSAPIDIFDMTKVWPKKQYPLRNMGRVVLDRNPENWFAEIEQAAFSPSTMVPGIAPSPDPMLQARMFAYPDSARYRLGVNYQFLPTNAAKSEVYCPIERDGAMNFTKNYGGDPNYIGTKLKPVSFIQTPVGGNSSGGSAAQNLDSAQISTPAAAFTTTTDRDFEQPRALWQIMETQEGAQERFINNVAAHVSDVTEPYLREQVYAMFAKVDGKLGEMIKVTTETKIEGSHAHPHKTAWH